MILHRYSHVIANLNMLKLFYIKLNNMTMKLRPILVVTSSMLDNIMISVKLNIIAHLQLL